jgi:drug/metabolite transporter (DMT)-like permease
MTRLTANLLLTLTAVIWGTAFVAQNLGMKDIGPLAFTGIRFLLGALIVLPLAMREYRRLNARQHGFTRREWAGAAGLGLLLAGGATLQQVGIVGTTVTNAAFFTVLYVPLVPLFGWLLFRALPHWSVWPAAAGCVAGTFLLGGGQLSSLTNGDWWVLAGALFWAGHVLLVGRVAAAKGAAITVACTQFVVCGAVCLAVALVVEPVTAAGLVSATPAILYAGILSVGVAFTLQVVAQRHTPAADAAIILSSETLFGALSGALFLGERLDAMQATGCVLILACILAVQLVPQGEARRPAERAA